MTVAPLREVRPALYSTQRLDALIHNKLPIFGAPKATRVKRDEQPTEATAVRLAQCSSWTPDRASPTAMSPARPAFAPTL